MEASSQIKIYDNAVAWIVGLILTILAFAFFGIPRQHILASGARVDLGSVSLGQSARKSFSISNPTATPMIIDGWAPSCHCMMADFPQTVIPPGRSIDAYVKTSASTPLGKRAAVIAIQWHFAADNCKRTDNLIVSAKYVSPFSLSEDRLDFGIVPLNEGRTISFQARAGNSAHSWNSLKGVPESDRLTTTIIPIPQGYKVEVRIDPRGLPAGVWKSSVSLLASENGLLTGEKIDVPVVAEIKGPFLVSPSVLQFVNKPNVPLLFKFKVDASTIPIRHLHFLSASVQNPHVDILGEGKEAIVTGTLSYPESNGPFVGKIPFQINECPEGSVRLTYVGRSE